MYRESLLATGFFLFLLTSASAEIYRCRTAEGRLIMTDNQANLPAGCIPIEPSQGAGSFNIMPSTAGDSMQSPAGQSGEAVNPDRPEPAIDWQGQAEELVRSYNDALTRRYHATRVTEKREALRQVDEFRRKRLDMLDRLDTSGLSRAERQAVRHTLDGIRSR
jgi:hypothetical protein